MTSKQFFFFFSNAKIENDSPTLTGGKIKALIKAAVPDFDETHTLVLEGQGNDEDQVIGDDEEVSFEIGDGQGPRRFFSQPPANFG